MPPRLPATTSKSAGFSAGTASRLARRPTFRQTDVYVRAHDGAKARDDKEDAGVANSSTLKVRVNRDKCQGHNRCKALAPELFELDEYGNAREKGDGTVPPGLEEKAYLAKSTCPEFAVEVIET